MTPVLPQPPFNRPSPPQQHPATPHRLPPPPSLSEPSGAWNEKPPIPTYNSSAPPFTGYPGQGSVGGQPAPTTVIVHADANPDGGDPAKKKNKFGKLGSTMGNAAAGGVGFGAGAGQYTPHSRRIALVLIKPQCTFV